MEIITFDLPMEAYPDQRKRTIRVLLPKSYDGKKRFPVLYMHDGQNLFDDELSSSGVTLGKWNINHEMKGLEEEGFPAIIVGIDNGPERFSELCPDLPVNQDMVSMFGLPSGIKPTGHLYGKFITAQLKPFIDDNYMTLPDLLNTAVGGASMGGLISLDILLRYPGVYSKAMVFAPYFMAHTKNDIMGSLLSYDFARLKDSRIFIFHGGLDIDASTWPYAQLVFEVMRDKGLNEEQLALVYDSRQPHHETAWQKYFGEAFRYLFRRGLPC
ncbi:MAG: alpha/beta hydrolase-fold protein [Lachnospiraceae bacterium]|nr:alpha/beta hydrolase-fold protein [Lachnospiraceae bacterium]